MTEGTRTWLVRLPDGTEHIHPDCIADRLDDGHLSLMRKLEGRGWSTFAVYAPGHWAWAWTKLNPKGVD